MVQNMEELSHSLVRTTLELETMRLAAQEELRRRDDQLAYLKDLLNRTIRERDEAQDKCQRLLSLLQNHHQQTANLSGISSIEDEPRRGIDSNNGFSSSDCEESIVSSPVIEPVPPPPPPPPPQLQQQPSMPEAALQLVSDKPLPEKGKLLQAVMKAGPLLQTLLLAGPLPQWRHPPPHLESFEIPPVTIPSQPHPQPLLQQDSLINSRPINNNIDCGRIDRKRALCEDSDTSIETKYQRVALP